MNVLLKDLNSSIENSTNNIVLENTSMLAYIVFCFLFYWFKLAALLTIISITFISPLD